LRQIKFSSLLLSGQGVIAILTSPNYNVSEEAFIRKARRF
jgi:hypothetical protein